MLVSRPTLIYFENLVGRLLEHPDGYAIVEYAPGKRELSDLQAFLTHTSQLLRTRSWYKLLADQSAMSPFTAEESSWIKDYWLARRERSIYGAVVLSQDVFARLAMNNLVNEMQEAALTYRMFDDVVAAEAWLQQQS